MTVEQMRIKYRELRNRLNEADRNAWNKLEDKLKLLQPQPQPIEWLAILNNYVNECVLEAEIEHWTLNRLRNENGWGENPNPQEDIEGWNDFLPPWKKLDLVKRQIMKDIQTEISYSEWEEDFHERN